MAKANMGPSRRKVAGFGLIGGSLVLVLCCGGCLSVFADSDGGSKRAGGADKTVNQQVASTESPATSILRGVAPSPSEAPNSNGAQEDSPEKAIGTTPAPTPPQAIPTTSTPTKVTTTKAAPKPTPKKTTTKPKPQPSKTTSKPKPKPSKTTSSVYYKNCAAVRAAGKAPIYRGQPGYGRHLDRDGDGVGCE